jgi:hypothetical protein
MRILVRVLAVLLGVVVVGLIVLALQLPRLVQSDAVRGRLQAEARNATGREVTWQELDVGLLPPRLVVKRTRVDGPAPEAPPFFQADSVSLELALAPLLHRVVVVDSLQLDAAVLNLRRDAGGIQLPQSEAKPDAREAAPPDASASDAATETSGGLELAVREVDVRDLHVSIHDTRDASTTQLEVQGPVTLRGEPSGAFRLDATPAAIAYAEAFRKPAGVALRVEGRLQRDDAGLRVDDLRMQLADAVVNGRLQSAARTTAALEAPPFAVAGLGPLLPTLAGRQLSGSLALQGLRVVTDPLELNGTLHLDGVSMGTPGQPPVRVTGAVEGRGRRLETRELTLVTAGQTIPVSAGLELGEPGFFQVRARGEALDGSALVRAYSGKEFFEGPVTFDAQAAGSPGGERPMVETVAGKGRLDIGRGKIRGVSLLRSSFQVLGTFAEAAILVNRARGSKNMDRYYTDEFESIGATIRVERGRASTDDLKIVYPYYTADLRGSMGLADGSLDLTGELALHREAEAELKTRVIPLARITGSVDAPRVDLSPQAVASLAAREELQRNQGKLSEKLDDKLGKGSGEAITEALDGLLGGRKR